ncbi:uncharacterized protein LOC122255286 isoform X2 [Penaeus japonicus]|uniref:uncharacterized protein LOC122255286 isoform X2 n=1 Tax=Penaeus japonicus TaxID=27405 RepID=UPI001C70E9A6|nr:uncharacterized protein LOC122255286 isoform X2 [Penaeus japonicus]
MADSNLSLQCMSGRSVSGRLDAHRILRCHPLDICGTGVSTTTAWHCAAACELLRDECKETRAPFVSGISGPQLTDAACDPQCTPHRLARAGVPMRNGSTKTFWWPEEDSRELIVNGNGMRMSLNLQDPQRNQWHEIDLLVTLTDDIMEDWLGRQGGGKFSVHVPSLSVREEKSCVGRFCSSLILETDRASWWAFRCDGPPCGCPEFANCTRTAEQTCSMEQLTDFTLLLDRPQTVFWRPEVVERLNVRWGSRLQHELPLELKGDLLFEWMKAEVVLVDGGTNGNRACTLNIPALNISKSCSDADSMIFHSDVPLLLGFGCSRPPTALPLDRPVTAGKSKGSWAWISFLVIAIIVGVGALVYFLVRRRNRSL